MKTRKPNTFESNGLGERQNHLGDTSTQGDKFDIGILPQWPPTGISSNEDSYVLNENINKKLQEEFPTAERILRRISSKGYTQAYKSITNSLYNEIKIRNFKEYNKDIFNDELCRIAETVINICDNIISSDNSMLKSIESLFEIHFTDRLEYPILALNKGHSSTDLNLMILIKYNRNNYLIEYIEESFDKIKSLLSTNNKDKIKSLPDIIHQIKKHIHERNLEIDENDYFQDAA